MGFGGLTSGERKRLQQGILSPKEATVVSARAEAAGGGGGFWSSTWGQVIRGVGIAALNFVPVVGSVASTAVGTADRAHFANLSAKAKAQYAAELAASQQRTRTTPPIMETLPYPWLPDYGNLAIPGYAGGTYSFGTPSGGTSGLAEFSKIGQGITPGQWLIIGVLGAVLLLSLTFVKRKR